MANTDADRAIATSSLIEPFIRVRAASTQICAPLTIEDHVVQAIPEVSPAKWHLAHSSWFFETFVLAPFVFAYRVFHPRYRHLFNSYYNQVEDGYFPRPKRGLLARPTVAEIMAYREHVDAALIALLEAPPSADTKEIYARVRVGLHHEQQHQELLLTDIKVNFSVNPLRPAYRDDLVMQPAAAITSMNWIEHDAGLVEIGFDGDGFAFDNERPRHATYLQPYAIADRLVTNREYLAFIEDGGYQRAELWLSDGWAMLQQQRWQQPLYWQRHDDEWQQFTLGGMRSLHLDEPVCHVSYYEADAYASWAGARLPGEAEWETAAATQRRDGNFRDSKRLHPAPVSAGNTQFYGDTWEWTRSAYHAYPGYRQPAGALGEYNGKFMSNQYVLKGGSCVTPADHIRATYRNFFYPHDRWQFMGIRLAKDL